MNCELWPVCTPALWSEVNDKSWLGPPGPPGVAAPRLPSRAAPVRPIVSLDHCLQIPIVQAPQGSGAISSCLRPSSRYSSNPEAACIRETVVMSGMHMFELH